MRSLGGYRHLDVRSVNALPEHGQGATFLREELEVSLDGCLVHFQVGLRQRPLRALDRERFLAAGHVLPRLVVVQIPVDALPADLAAGSRGLFTAVSAGPVTVTAAFQGITGTLAATVTASH